MKNTISLKLQDPKYYKRFLYVILEHIKDDDYFYNKKTNWDEWIVMRIDVENALKRVKERGEITLNTIEAILNILN